MVRVLLWALLLVAAAAVVAALGSSISAYALLGIATGLVVHKAWSSARRPARPLTMRETLERKLQKGELTF